MQQLAGIISESENINELFGFGGDKANVGDQITIEYDPKDQLADSGYKDAKASNPALGSKTTFKVGPRRTLQITGGQYLYNPASHSVLTATDRPININSGEIEVGKPFFQEKYHVIKSITWTNAKDKETKSVKKLSLS